MTHDFNKPFLDVISSRIEPLPVFVRGSKCLSTPRCNLIIRDLPSKMFEASSIAEDLFKLSVRLTKKFSHQCIEIPRVSLVVYVATEDAEHTFEFDGLLDTNNAFYCLKRLLLTTFGTIYIELNVSCPLSRASSVYDFFINALHRQYLLCRDIQNTYECQNVLF